MGFLGIYDPKKGSYVFCHDGSTGAEISFESSSKIIIHPCFWVALSCRTDLSIDEVSVQINDEYEAKVDTTVVEQRTRLLGQIVSKLPSIPRGKEGAYDFEDWCARAIKILFSGKLSNIEQKPNKDAISRRDIVGTNSAEHGFWKRIWDDYHSRQVIFEVKNYEELTLDDFRQLLSYLTGSYGDIGFFITRSSNERPTDKELEWTKEIFNTHGKTIIILNADLLSRFISKVRSYRKDDYAEEKMKARLDLYIRSYLAAKHARKK